MLATRRISRTSSRRSTLRSHPFAPQSTRASGSIIEPAYRIIENGTYTRMETRTAGGLRATVIVDKTTDDRDYTYGWFRESPINLTGVPLTFFCTLPDRDIYDSEQPEIQLHFREITRAVRRRSNNRNDLHRYFELVLRVQRQVFNPFTRLWSTRWQVMGHTRPIPVPPPLRFEMAVQQMEIVNGRQCLIVFFYYCQEIARSIIRGQISAAENSQPSSIEPFEDQWEGSFNPRELETPANLDNEMERIIAGIRDIL